MNYTPAQRVTIGLFAQTILLLLIYSMMILLAAVKLLPQDPLATWLSYAQANNIAQLSLNLAILTGFIAGGLYVVSNEHPKGLMKSDSLLLAIYRLWTILLAGALLANFPGIFGNWRFPEPPPLLNLIPIVLAFVFVIMIARSVIKWTAFPKIWTIGMIVSLLCAGLSFIQQPALRAFVISFNLNIAYILVALALAFWLMKRFSNVTQQWADHGLYIQGGLLSIAGLALALIPLYPLETAGALRNFAPLYVLFAYFMLGARSYRALADRNPTATLAAHWCALAVILFLFGNGALGAIHTIPSIQPLIQSTHLTDTRDMLTSLGIIAVILGFINQATAEIRGHNARITGLMPFWLVTFGAIGGGLALAAAGIVQTYLERILMIDHSETQRLLVPLYIFWIIGLLLLAPGFLVYALGFWARRPVERIME